jgi:hypothetical protein
LHPFFKSHRLIVDATPTPNLIGEEHLQGGTLISTLAGRHAAGSLGFNEELQAQRRCRAKRCGFHKKPGSSHQYHKIDASGMADASSF